MAIKVYKNTDAGAPTLSGVSGSLITLLDAVLVNGYNTVSVTSITRSGAVATLTAAADHGFATGDWASVTGAGEAEYNGQVQVTVTSTTVFTYAVTGTPATPATGTISIERAAAGFTKAFTATNKASYRSDDVTGTRLYMQVLDNAGGTGGAKEARVRGYEVMTTTDAGTGPFPTAAQSSFGHIWKKSTTADATTRPWVIITDGKIIYFFCQADKASADGIVSLGSHWHGVFGDFISYKTGDTYGSITTGASTQDTDSFPEGGLFTQLQNAISAPSTHSDATYVARDHTGVGTSRFVGYVGTGLTPSLGATSYTAYPHPTDNGFYITPVVITQASPPLFRGRLPGVYEPLHGRALQAMDIIENVQGLTGRKLLCVYGNYSSTPGCIMIDITGPWEA